MRPRELFMLSVKTLTSNVILKCMRKYVVTCKAFSWPKATATRYALPQGAITGLKFKAGINLHSFLIFALICPQTESYKVKCRVNKRQMRGHTSNAGTQTSSRSCGHSQLGYSSIFFL